MPINSSPKKSSTLHKAAPPLKRAYIIFGVIIGAVFIIASIIILIPFINSMRMKSTITDEVNKARTAKGLEIGEQRLKSISHYAEQGIIKSPTPLYSSLVDACYLAHNDSGWTVNSHYQECYLRYVDVFETDLTDEQYLSLVMPGEDISSRLDELKQSIKTCSDDRTMLGSPENTEMGYTASNATNNICSLPNQFYGTRVVLYAINNIVSSQEVSGDIKQVTGDKTNIIVVADYSYYKKDIGCKPLSLFCASPLNKPVVGEMKV